MAPTIGEPPQWGVPSSRTNVCKTCKTHGWIGLARLFLKMYNRNDGIVAKDGGQPAGTQDIEGGIKEDRGWGATRNPSILESSFRARPGHTKNTGARLQDMVEDSPLLGPLEYTSARLDDGRLEDFVETHKENSPSSSSLEKELDDLQVAGWRFGSTHCCRSIGTPLWTAGGY